MKQFPESNVARHLKDLTFKPSSDTAVCIRGAMVMKRKTSGSKGKPGNVRRKRRLKHCDYKRGASDHVQDKRGLQPQQQRRGEYLRKLAREKNSHVCLTSLRPCSCCSFANAPIKVFSRMQVIATPSAKHEVTRTFPKQSAFSKLKRIIASRKLRET